ncbi:MAG: hypothetical protein ACRDA5_10785 [Clostridium sp.]
MKKRTKETIAIGVGLVLLSLALHYGHFLMFNDAHHTLIFLFADIAFIPMEVFFTTLIIDRLLEKREKDHFVEKLNMIVGLFYTEIGTRMLSEFVKGDNGVKELSNKSLVGTKWDDDTYKSLQKDINNYDFKVNLDNIDLVMLKQELRESRDLLITLITNENLHEHETFTEMLMSLMHLKEEINTRCCLEIEQYEKAHIESDMAAVYKYLTLEWCHYMNYLSNNYPSLFCKALINNPFDGRNKREKDEFYLQLKK